MAAQIKYDGSVCTLASIDNGNVEIIGRDLRERNPSSIASGTKM